MSAEITEDGNRYVLDEENICVHDTVTGQFAPYAYVRSARAATDLLNRGDWHHDDEDYWFDSLEETQAPDVQKGLQDTRDLMELMGFDLSE